MGKDETREGASRSAFETRCDEQGIDLTWACDETIRPDEEWLQETLMATAEGIPTSGRLETLPRLMIKATSDGEEGDEDIEILSRLGAGGMGIVQLARQRALQREVAIKRPRPDASAGHVQALLREATITGAIEHPGVIPVHALGVSENDEPIMVMKRVEGQEWSALIHEPSMQDEEVGLERHLEIMIRVCNALEFAHDRGIIHRDIKPTNIMIGDYGEVYLMDWGVAMRLDERGGAGTNKLVGTPSYMAPEMALAELHAQDARTDIYLLGATLHEVLTGEPRNSGEQVVEVLVSAAKAPPFDYGDRIPVELAQLCNQACARDPADRFEDVAALRRALQSFLQHRGSMQIHASALEQLETLEALAGSTQTFDSEEDALRVFAMYNRARFGFEQALAGWPENTASDEGLQRCIRAMFEIELRRRNVSAARLLFSELHAPSDAEREHLEEAEREHTAAQDALERLQALEREMLVRADNWRLFVVLTGHGTIWLILLLIVGHGTRLGTIPMTQEVNFYFGLFIIIQAVLFGRGFLKGMFKTRIRRQTISAFFAYCLAFNFNRVFALVRDSPLQDTFMADFAVVFATVGLLASYVSPYLWIGAGVIVGCAVLSALYPAYTIDLAGFVTFFLNLQTAWLTRPLREEPAGEPTD